MSESFGINSPAHRPNALKLHQAYAYVSPKINEATEQLRVDFTNVLQTAPDQRYAQNFQEELASINAEMALRKSVHTSHVDGFIPHSEFDSELEKKAKAYAKLPESLVQLSTERYYQLMRKYGANKGLLNELLKLCQQSNRIIARMSQLYK